MLIVGSCLVFVVILLVVRCWLSDVRCLLFVVCGLLFVVYCLFVCLLLVVPRCWLLCNAVCVVCVFFVFFRGVCSLFGVRCLVLVVR